MAAPAVPSGGPKGPAQPGGGGKEGEGGRAPRAEAPKPSATGPQKEVTPQQAVQNKAKADEIDAAKAKGEDAALEDIVDRPLDQEERAGVVSEKKEKPQADQARKTDTAKGPVADQSPVPTHQDGEGTDSARAQQFRQLQRQVREQVQNDLKARIATNKTFRGAELKLQKHLQAFEQQARKAVETFTKKGYKVKEAGFDPANPEVQRLIGNFTLSEKAKIALKEMGVGIAEDRYHDETTISFGTKEADLSVIQGQWDEIAKKMPRSGGLLRTIAIILAGIFQDIMRKTSAEVNSGSQR